jgi:hypothetical protein
MDDILCAVCGKPATCEGTAEGNPTVYAMCDDCCGHGNEDGHCEELPQDEAVRRTKGGE